MKRLTFSTLIFILFFCFIFVYLLYNSFNYLDNDLGWHLKVGEGILASHQVPSLDKYDYLLAGKTWVDHEWLMNLISFFIYNKFGYIALSIFFAFIALASFIILYVFTKREYLKTNTEGSGLLMVLLLLGIIAALPHLGVRMQEVTLLFFILMLIAIDQFEKNRKSKIIYCLPLLFMIWANLHAGFLIGLAVLGFWVSVKIVEKILYRYNFFSFLSYGKLVSGRSIIRFSVVAVLSALATLLTPYGLKLYLFLADYKNSAYQKLIAEWLPFNYFPIKYWQLLYAAIVLSVLLVIFYLAYKREKDSQKNAYQLELWPFLLSIIFLLLALKSRRHFPLFFAATLPMTAGFLFRFLSLPVSWKRYFYENKIIRFYVVATLLLVIPLLLFKTKFTQNPFAENAISNGGYPFKAVEFIKNDPQLSDQRIFNNYSWGGYLIWVWPGKQLFIDGRLPQYPYNNHTLLEEYLEFYDQKKAGEKLDQYNIGLVLFRIDQPLKINWVEKYIFGFKEEEFAGMIKNNGLKEYLENTKGWEKSYSDNISAVYVRK